jgi:hypothetical protein
MFDGSIPETVWQGPVVIVFGFQPLVDIVFVAGGPRRLGRCGRASVSSQRSNLPPGILPAASASKYCDVDAI